MRIPDTEVKDFIGEVKNYYKNDVNNVYDDRFRIDVWTREKKELIDHFKIAESYFVTYEDGKIIDRTKK